ncbi:MAG: acyl-CoA dehydrogenase family protein [Pseudomonadota bacterium]
MTNQSPGYSGHNAFDNDGALRQLVRDMPPEIVQGLRTQGKWVASPEALDLARLANIHTPTLRTHDARGDRLDLVEFHPAYHALMRRGVADGLHGSIWAQGGTEQGWRNAARAARFFLTSQLESGHTCPLTMTNASIAALMTSPETLKDWMPKILSSNYDSSNRSPGAKTGLTIGMGMTERQGGSDVRQNTTRAEKSYGGGHGVMWRVNGEKWFFSAPMSDAFLVLAKTDVGISCFLIPRLLPDGSSNGLQFQRLKDKIGNRSNASSEVVFKDALGTLIGEEGRGISTILEMVTLTRLDCAVGSAGQMRAAFAEALHHARHRSSFDKLLVEHPLMERVLADMALDVAAAQALVMRLARSFDRAASDEREQAFARLMTPVVKYWVCKITPPLVGEALECLGGNGYVEDGPMARIYRDASLNSIWEGSGNIMCLDVLRVMKRGPQAVQTVLDQIQGKLEGNTSQSTDVLRVAGDMAMEDEGAARMFTEQLALTAAAAELRQIMPEFIADAFIETRLGRPWRHTYGMQGARHDSKAILDFVCPA